MIDVQTTQARYSISKSWQDVERLHVWLRRHFPTIKLPDLPGAVGSWFKSPEKIAESRVPVVNQLLARLFQTKDVFFTWEVQHFLDANRQVRSRVFRGALLTNVTSFSPRQLGIDSLIPVRTPEGLLYVKVISAAGLPVVKAGKPIDPYVKVRIAQPIEAPSKSALKTDVYPSSSDPQVRSSARRSVSRTDARCAVPLRDGVCGQVALPAAAPSSVGQVHACVGQSARARPV